MAEMSWKDAARKVLEDSGTSLHYVDIADRILDQGLKKKFGATPHRTLNSVISTAIQAEGAACLFERTDTGVYALRGRRPVEPGTDDDAEAGSLEAFGMHWKREDVLWSTNPRLWARIRPKADKVDLGGQLGVYVLYDDLGRVVYTGQAAKQSIGRRLNLNGSEGNAAASRQTGPLRRSRSGLVSTIPALVTPRDRAVPGSHDASEPSGANLGTDRGRHGGLAVVRFIGRRRPLAP